MAKKKALGRGIGALIKEQGFDEQDFSVKNEEEAQKELPVSKIVANPYQPRKTFDKTELENLAHSIEVNGLLYPVLVRKHDKIYQLIAGERRWRAYKILKRKTIPAIITDVDDDKMGELALIENIQREDLSPIEVAEAYQTLLETYTLKHDALAKRLGKSRSAITNTLRLLELPESTKTLVAEGKLSAGHARTILSAPDDVSRETLADEIIREGYSVRQAEERAKMMKKGEKPVQPVLDKKTKTQPERKDPNIKKLEKDLEYILGSKVTIVDAKGKGRIVIEYANNDDFSRILDILEK